MTVMRSIDELISNQEIIYSELSGGKIRATPNYLEKSYTSLNSVDARKEIYLGGADLALSVEQAKLLCLQLIEAIEAIEDVKKRYNIES